MKNWARYLTPSALHRALGLVCLGVGVQTSTERLTSERVLDCYAAVLITRGAGDLVLGTGSEPLRVLAPALFWLRPGIPHLYGPDPDVGWTESWVLFDGPAAEGYEGLGYIPTHHPLQPLHNPLPLVLAHKQLAASCHSTAGDVDVVTGVLVHEFLVTARDTAAGAGDSQDGRVLTGLREDAMLDMSVVDRAARLGVSPRKLGEILQRCTGSTVTEFVRKERINRAKTLLAETDLSVTEVASAVGFGDPAYFSRSFRARVGMSPRDFRQQQQRFLG